MNYYERIQHSIDYMEQNMECEIKVEDMAKQAYMSVSNYYRMFFAITGIQAKEYLIYRRISKAAEDIRQEQGKIIDIAMKYAYNSPDAFSRIFKKVTGYSPSTYTRGMKNYVYERMNVMEKYFKDEDVKTMEEYPDIKLLKDLPTFKVAYYCYYGSAPEAGAFQVMKEWVLKNRLDVKNGNYRIFGYNAPDGDTSQDEYGYEVCVTIPDDMEVDDPKVKTKKLSGGFYAVISIERKGDLGDAIMKGWDRFSKWLDGSRYVYGESQWLEEHLGFDEHFEHLGGVDLYLPIKEKTELDDIETKEVIIEPFTVVTCTFSGHNAEKKARDYMFRWAKDHGIDFNNDEVRLFAYYNSERIGKPDFYYKLYLKIEEKMQVDNDMLVKEIFQGGLYLRRQVKYKINAQSWYNFIHVIETSRCYTFGTQPFMEEYLINKPEINRETEVAQYMPVKKI